MFALEHRSRCSIAATGAVLIGIALALVPLYGSSAVNATMTKRDNLQTAAASLSDDLVPGLPQIRDPFARYLPAPPSTIPVPQLKKRTRRGHPFVRAIVAGPQPRALVEDGSTRIVAIGDDVDGSAIVDIEPDTLVLHDGRRLGFGETVP